MCPVEGIVLQYNRQNGWGFIRPDSPDLPDFFVCYKFLEAANKFERFLKPGQRVEFDAIDPDGKREARRVRVLRPITIARQVIDKAVQS
jgi:cold shock CspA family protein